MEPSRIRRLKTADLPELLELCREHAAYEKSPWRDFEERLSQLETLFLTSAAAREGANSCWVAEGDGELAGFATASLELSTWDAGHFLHMDCMFLRPAYRGRSIGQALFAELARQGLLLGALNVQWQTPVWNDGAARFYRRLGATDREKLRFTLSREALSEIAHAEPGALKKNI